MSVVGVCMVLHPYVFCNTLILGTLSYFSSIFFHSTLVGSRWQNKPRAGPATKQAAKDREDIECILIIAVMELQSKLHHRGR